MATIKHLLLAGLTFLNFYALSQSFTVTYGFPDVSTTTGRTDPSNTPSVQGMSFGSFFAAGTAANPSASGRFSFTGWPTGGIDGTDDYSNFTGALSPTVYYEVALSVAPGYTLSLNTASFSVRRSGTGIRHYCVRSGRDNYINNLAVSTGTNTRVSVIPGNVFFWNYDSVSTSSDQRGSTVLFGNEFSAVTNTVNLRIYAWNAESSGGSFSIDDFSFSGVLKDSLANMLGLAVIPYTNNKALLYPNPSRDGIVYLDQIDSGSVLEVFSPTGESLIKKIAETPRVVLNLDHLSKGIYIIQAISGARILRNKLVFLAN